MQIFSMMSSMLKSASYNLALRERQGGWSAAFGYVRLVAVVYRVFRHAKVACFWVR